jgi:glycosyl transferase family 1
MDASALWLVPGLEHPAYKRFSAFFETLFKRYRALDYRQHYLDHGAASLRRAIASAMEDERPDILLYSQFPASYSYLSPQFVGGFRDRARIVALGFDDEIYFEQSKFFYLQCDAVITTDIPDAARLRSAGIPVHFAQLEAPQASPGDEVMADDIPVSFVGDMTKPGRRKLVQALEDTGIAVQDFGHGSRNGRLSDAEVRRVFRRSQINLNFTRTNPPAWVVRSHPARAVAYQIKGRPFELAALKRFCLCEWGDCVEYWFKAGAEIGVFRDRAELIAEVRKYLADASLRHRMAAAAHDRYRRDYAPAVQFERIFSEILAQPGKAPGPADGAPEPIFYESVGRSRASAFLHALRRGRPLRALQEAMGEDAARMDYWRGFTGGVSDTVIAQMRRP